MQSIIASSILFFLAFQLNLLFSFISATPKARDFLLYNKIFAPLKFFDSIKVLSNLDYKKLSPSINATFDLFINSLPIIKASGIPVGFSEF